MKHANADQAIVRSPWNIVRIPLLLIAFFLILAVPLPFLFLYGLDGSDLKSISNLAQALDAAASGIALLLAALIFVVLLETRMRTRIAADGIHRARVFVHLIDSHLLSKEEVQEFVRGPGPCDPKGLSREGTIDYLLFAGALARLAGKAGVLYAQWLPRETLIRESEELFQASLQVERNCLQKIEIIRAAAGYCAPDARAPR